MKTTIYILTIFMASQVLAQKNKAEDFGFRHFQTIYKGDTVDILIKSKKGDELKKKANFSILSR
ncbi:hypothetical protein CLV55_101309 [Flavobacterium aciduliphilum]|uniref:Uncharacterized protein n=1 Tax=Flavobacterium aciduliphilum TaxID=1101402 RepID=A0A328YP21_9FLAO|nr:hypothetical protein CLV55_101309 [Flavobacterium aciduliphilum]